MIFAKNVKTIKNTKISYRNTYLETNNFDSLAPNARRLEFRKQAITPD
jgi:hypothetical protein